MNTDFKFKQFSISQDNCAMKVGTDGVLLGAWVNIKEEESSILDIGTGTGLIALMLAQRNPNAFITGIEIDKLAAIQANENSSKSNFKNQIIIQDSSLQDYKSTKKFDLIVSNPPFFVPNIKMFDKKRKEARHTSSLTFKELLTSSYSLLTKDGTGNFIIPFDREEEFLKIAKQSGFYASRITQVKGNNTSPFKRSLIELGKTTSTPILSKLTIEISRHVYTKEYIELVKNFYLKM